MKKVISIKEMMIILISVVLITVLTTNVFALNIENVISGEDNLTAITGNEYDNAQNVENAIEDTNDNTNTNTNTNNNTNNNTNTSKNNTTNNSVKKYNTNSKDLPQTGIEDYNVGILLIICIASAIFAYKKVSDYRNI